MRTQAARQEDLCSCLQWGTVSETTGILGYPPYGLVIHQQFPRRRIDLDLSDLPDDPPVRETKHHRYRPAQSFSDDQVRLLTAQLAADLHDDEAGHPLAG